MIMHICVSGVRMDTCGYRNSACIQKTFMSLWYISLGARPNSSGAKSRELGLGLETLAAFPCALAECGQSQ